MSRVTDGLLDDRELRLILDRYQEILRLPIEAFNGLNNPDALDVYECPNIWKQSERDFLATFIAQAEEMREEELGYHLAPIYIDDEEQDYGVPTTLNRKYLIEIGTKTTTIIEAGVVLDLGVETAPNDPVVVTVATTVTATDEVKVFYPGEDIEIRPSNISISGGIATIRIPRSRLVDPDLNDDREDHLSYYENDNFLVTVDISRVYTDTSDGAYLVWDSVARVVAGVQTYPDARETTQRANIQILGQVARRIAEISTYPASTDGSGSTFVYCVQPTTIRVSYLSGKQSSMRTELETARLSHILSPRAPITCPYVMQLWAEDRAPDSSGIVTPYGGEKGAVRAWISDSRAKVGRQGGKFPRLRGRY